MVFENVSPSPSMVFGGINHRQQWFFDGGPNFRDQWLTVVTEEKKHILPQTQIHDKFTYTYFYPYYSYYPHLPISCFKFAILKHVSNIFFEILLDFALARNESRKLSTIVKNQWFLGSPLPLMEW